MITDAKTADAGLYDVVATNALGVTTASSILSIADVTNPGRLINVSVRSAVGEGANVLIAGFVVGGVGTSGTLPVLVRASGPALDAFQVEGSLADPSLQLNFPGGSILTNSGWAGSPSVTQTAASVGAFPWTDPSSKDSALVGTLGAGAYTAVVSGASGDTGIALAEVYDASPPGAVGPRLINLSARAMVGSGANILIAGFVIGGTTSKTVLIRASGPAIAAAPYNVPGTLADPELQLSSTSGNGTSVVLATNTGWTADPHIQAAATAVGAFFLGNLGNGGFSAHCNPSARRLRRRGLRRQRGWAASPSSRFTRFPSGATGRPRSRAGFSRSAPGSPWRRQTQRIFDSGCARTLSNPRA